MLIIKLESVGKYRLLGFYHKSRSSGLLDNHSVPNRPGRPIGPAGTLVPGVPGRVSQDGRAKRPNLNKTAVLGVDGRALQSLVRWALPVVICKARPSTVGPGRQL